MGEIIKDLEDQFGTICISANEVSGLLEASRVHYTASSELCGKVLYSYLLFIMIIGF